MAKKQVYFMNYIFMLLGLLIFIFLILLVIDYRRAIAKKYFIKLAKKLNVSTHTPKGFLSEFPEIKGFYKGYMIRVFMYNPKDNTGKLKRFKVHTAIEIKIDNPKKYKLSVYEEGPISTLGKYLGMQDIVVGHPEFDKEYIVKTNNEYITKQILNEKICNELVYMANRRFGFEFQFGLEDIYYEEPMLMINEQRTLWVERVLNVLIDLYDEFNKHTK